MRKRRKFSEILAFWLAGRFSIAREDGADDARSGHNRGRFLTTTQAKRQPAGLRAISRYLAPNDKVAEPTSWFPMAAPAALR
jgi:hypothetical protein